MASEAVFNYKVVRQFTVMTVIWGVVCMLPTVYVYSLSQPGGAR